VSKKKRRTRAKSRLENLAIKGRVRLVGNENGGEIGAPRPLLEIEAGKSGGQDGVPPGGGGTKSDAHVDARVAKIEGLSASLGAVSKDDDTAQGIVGDRRHAPAFAST
jgi:hypothetical protein